MPHNNRENFAFAFSINSPEPPVDDPREHARNQKNNKEHKVNAFDLLFVDCSQDIVEGALMSNDNTQVVRFHQTDQAKPENRKDETNPGDRFSGGWAHR